MFVRRFIVLLSLIIATSCTSYKPVVDHRGSEEGVPKRYDDDLSKVKKTLENLVKADKRILKDPACTIAVSELADSSVNLVLRPWVNSADYWVVKFDLIEAIKTTFDKEGISIPYPQQDMRIVSSNDNAGKKKLAA